MVTSTSTTTTAPRVFIVGAMVVEAAGVTHTEVEAAVKRALSEKLLVPIADIHVSAEEARRLGKLRGKRRLTNQTKHWIVKYTIQVSPEREFTTRQAIQSLSDTASVKEFEDLVLFHLAAGEGKGSPSTTSRSVSRAIESAAHHLTAPSMVVSLFASFLAAYT